MKQSLKNAMDCTDFTDSRKSSPNICEIRGVFLAGGPSAVDYQLGTR
jgi:hypothetical protein